MKLLRVTGLEAARRQLETAVTLVFQSGDIVSIHTLGAAAREILERIDKSKGGVGGGVGLLDKQSGKWFRGIQNFFKHANKPEERPLIVQYLFARDVEAEPANVAVTLDTLLRAQPLEPPRLSPQR